MTELATDPIGELQHLTSEYLAAAMLVAGALRVGASKVMEMTAASRFAQAEERLMATVLTIRET